MTDFLRLLTTSAMVLSVNITHWDDTYASTASPTRSDGGARFERVRTSQVNLCRISAWTRSALTKKFSFFLTDRRFPLPS